MSVALAGSALPAEGAEGAGGGALLRLRPGKLAVSCSVKCVEDSCKIFSVFGFFGPQLKMHRNVSKAQQNPKI